MSSTHIAISLESDAEVAVDLVGDTYYVRADGLTLAISREQAERLYDAIEELRHRRDVPE